jgi:DnaD/phage-associated family protein
MSNQPKEKNRIDTFVPFVHPGGKQKFSITPAAAVSDASLSNGAFRTLAALGVFGDKNGWCWPGLSLIAKMRGMSKQAISKHTKELAIKGYIKKLPRFDKETGARKSDYIQIQFNPTPSTQEVDRVSTPEVDGAATSEVDRVSTPEVDINAPLNAPLNDTSYRSPALAEIEQLYESEIGPVTPTIADAIVNAEKEYPAGWTEDAIRTASCSNVRKWSYVRAILKRWKEDGKGTPFKSTGALGKPKRSRGADILQRLKEV